MKRILIVNVNWLGDVIFSTPFIRTLKKNNPDSFIVCLVVTRCKQILEDNPYLDKVIVYDEKSLHSGIIGKLMLVNEIKKYNFQSVYLLHRSLTRTIICFLAGIKERIGYSTKKRSLLLTHKIPCLDGSIHRAKFFLNVAESMGMETDGFSYDFSISDDIESQLDEILSKKTIKLDKGFIVISPGANWDLKRWPYDKFAKLSDRLIQELGFKVIITGANKDIKLANLVKDNMKEPIDILCGYLDLKQFGALLKRSSLLIANDSGPLHIARAVKTPVVGLYGPTSCEITGPIGQGKYKVIIGKSLDCKIPCYDLNCDDIKCMKSISTEEVFKACQEMLK